MTRDKFIQINLSNSKVLMKAFELFGGDLSPEEALCKLYEEWYTNIENTYGSTKYALDPGKIYLVVEDTGSGKNYWSSILDTTKITVVSLHDVSTTLSGNKSFPKFLMHLDTNKSTFLFLPDAVDIYQNNLTASIWSRIYKYANNKGNVIGGYIGFEWLFVNSDTVHSVLNKLVMNHINEYNKGYKITHSKCTKMNIRQ